MQGIGIFQTSKHKYKRPKIQASKKNKQKKEQNACYAYIDSILKLPHNLKKQSEADRLATGKTGKI